MSERLKLWHGSHRWSGRPEIRAPKKGKAEYGPGLYLTTNYRTAEKYAKGSGKVLMMELYSDITWLESEKRDLKVLIDFVKDCYGLRKKKQIVDELTQLSEKLKEGEVMMPVSYLVNTLVNNEVSHGQSGLLLNEWLVDQKIDASLANCRHSDDWVTVFNMKIIDNIYTKTQDLSEFQYQDFPSIKEQLGQLSGQKEHNDFESEATNGLR